MLKILNLLGLNVNDIAVVGDSKYDVEMALNAGGVKLVFFLGNYNDPRVISIRGGLLDIIGYLDQFPIKH